MGDQTFDDGGDLPGAFILSVNHLAESLAQGTVVVDVRKLEVLEGQYPQLGQGVGHGQCAGGDGFEQRFNVAGFHYLIGTEGECNRWRFEMATDAIVPANGYQWCDTFGYCLRFCSLRISCPIPRLKVSRRLSMLRT